MPPEKFPSSLRTVLPLLTFALVLTALTIICAGVIVDAVQHPARYATSAPTTSILPPAVDTSVMNLVENGLDVETGFVAQGDYLMVKSHCTGCHSAKLVLQNRATRGGWEEMIRWMQQTQQLWDLGEQEGKILDYLSTYYAPQGQGRRASLAIEEDQWYVIGE